MIRKFSFDEDLALKRFVATPAEQKPRFNWREVVLDEHLSRPEIKIESRGIFKAFDLAEVADMIGSALTDLLLSRDESDIYNDKNREFVAAVAERVAEYIAKQFEKDSEFTLTQLDLNLVIEKILVDLDAYDVAKSLVVQQALNGSNNRADDDNDDQEPVNVRLIRRNRQVVPWDQNKVEVAIRKSFLSLRLDSAPAEKVARAVTERVRNHGEAFVHIETVQDIAQEELMKAGHFKVAESYILYRSHRSHLRELEAEADVDTDSRQDAMIMLKNADGSTYFWNAEELRKRIDFASIGLELALTKEQIETELRRSLYAEMSRDDLRKTIILNAKSLIERDADFSKFAGRILVSYIYEEVLGWDIIQDGIGGLKEAHRLYFKTCLRRGVKIERLDPRLLEYDLDRLADALDPSADLDFDYLGISTLYDRYLIVDKTGKESRRMETPQLFWIRVSMGLFLDHEGDREDWVIRLYNLYKGRRFCSSTPTLFNSGTLHSQLSSCYLYKVDDSIESIMHRGIAENAFLSKWAGGLGGSWTSVRGTGGYIKGTNGESQGVIPFLKLHNDQLVAVNQGGKRRGSGCAYLETWHNDIVDFLELRKNTGDDRRRTHDMNTANWIPDLFMKRMEAREDWTLFRSNEVPDLHETYGKEFEEKYIAYEKQAEAGKIWSLKTPAIDMWKQMLRMLFETGHPWITFKDPCNVRSPQDHVGVIHSSNLCTEITLNTGEDETAVCNLGSVVLDRHIKSDGTLDLEMLRETIQIAVRALDNVIDINFYPTDAAATSNKRHRPIGLGVMGLQNALYKKDIAFASDEAVEFNDEFMEAIAYYAYEASSDLAAERGSYSSYKGSKWDRGLLPLDTLELLEKERNVEIDVPKTSRMDWSALRGKIAKQGMRNSNVLAIAPTATISNIMGTSPCIEPFYKNLFVKSNLGGEFIVLNQALVQDLKKLNLWNEDMVDQLKYFDGELENIDGIPEDLKKKYATAFGIEFKWFVEAAGRRQKWIDQSQSVNLFLVKPDLKTLSHMYRAAWRTGLKTTYYLRTQQASNIEKSTVSVKKEMRGVVGGAEEGKQEYTAEEKMACSIEAMRNGEECEACQ
ncbi:ribonucleoside-diphosphate reductase subunit alpha [Rubellicoccus peritrichatus]|uniref:Ribonucleoside-diphosphate reductase n=1 Tax=Rubellicoccus peritrichatus TaxID=3080537 RepID=A0AAQ3LFT4_9BACT|nr:ribonucleoside-diphosphate reductase subunit alpha [Puniceicoccus sp. CR14]WOO43003.1 ribonucleoside-diphosphate reductase subunit alpha [Puniceicoccus sp. CR14]